MAYRDPEKKREYDKRYYEANKEKRREYGKRLRDDPAVYVLAYEAQDIVRVGIAARTPLKRRLATHKTCSPLAFDIALLVQFGGPDGESCAYELEAQLHRVFRPFSRFPENAKSSFYNLSRNTALRLARAVMESTCHLPTQKTS